MTTRIGLSKAKVLSVFEPQTRQTMEKMLILMTTNNNAKVRYLFRLTELGDGP